MIPISLNRDDRVPSWGLGSLGRGRPHGKVGRRQPQATLKMQRRPGLEMAEGVEPVEGVMDVTEGLRAELQGQV